VESSVGDGGVHIDSIGVEEVWTRLKRDAESVLIDVRTIAELAYVGLPDLSPVGKRPVLVEWQGFDAKLNTAFVQRVTEALQQLGATTDSELFFICRSGSRSLKAAQAIASAGYLRCRNVVDGFEGPLDADRHRGRLGGWKAKGLPWVQG
jgi:rhodanese-related sulfurtransferase